jgi:hypothetical protein
MAGVEAHDKFNEINLPVNRLSAGKGEMARTINLEYNKQHERRICYEKSFTNNHGTFFMVSGLGRY